MMMTNNRMMKIMCLSVTMVVLVMFGCWGQIMMIILIMIKMMMTNMRKMKIMCLSVSVVGG